MVNKVVAGICGTIVLIVSIVLIAVSFDTVDVTEYGLRYSNVALKLEEKIYQNGRWHVGLGSTFVKYPRRLQCKWTVDVHGA